LQDHALWALHLAAPKQDGAGRAPLFQSMLTIPVGAAADIVQIFPTSIQPCSILKSASGAMFSINVSLMKPKSMGRVSLTSPDPSVLPRIQFNYFSDADDLPAMLEGVREARRVVAGAPLKEFVLQELYPGPQADLALAVRSGSSTYHHPVGTCRMGPASDERSVVDSRGQVHGCEGLFVIDASIMPTIPSANIHLSTLMVAERCAHGLRKI
jgi:choline dehydrogenase